ncbi:RimK family alpha-L-glutamate ligase [Neolewinella lacunae]|uniref:RimK family alpha-L-glutamate ligase n=1 Tax=Neolewinella lacunae TaxID=1517758 RepID=A0A923PMU6_9BACT|nr:RimK family alpha-L-glutamate ligase [Neolewinella lacunae]MBC6993427.1 RimK family alpha-L-glutamate ligase [Neolewinella lacunae]MDN3636297.1 RimK family alpha-L-glutamate ligase [Neolewinella lacunae]
MRISVFSRGPNLYSTSRIVAEGRKRGHRMEVVDHAYCSPSLYGVKTALLVDGRPLQLPKVAIPRIGANITHRGAAIIRQLDVLGVPHTLSADALLLARDKMGCLQTLARHDLPVPRTILCFTLREARIAALGMGKWPVVVKLLESTHGVGVALAKSLFELEQISEGFLQFQDRIIVQEFIGESKGCDIRAFVVGDRIVAAMERRAVDGEFRANIHRGATARAVHLSAEDEALCLRAAAVIGVEIAGVDLIPSHQGHLLMEVNASPGLEGIEAATRIDIAGEIIEYAVKKAKA